MSKIQLIEKQIGAAGNSVRISEGLDKDYTRLTGISVLSTIGGGHTLQSSSVAGKDLFPKNFEVEFLQSNNAVAPDERFFTLDEKAEGNKIELEFKDGGNAGNYPYTLKIYLKLEDCK